MNNIILIGAGGHANSCIEVLRSEKKFKIAGFVISNINEIINKDYNILGYDKDLPIIKKIVRKIFYTNNFIIKIKNYFKLRKYFK